MTAYNMYYVNKTGNQKRNPNIKLGFLAYIRAWISVDTSVLNLVSES